MKTPLHILHLEDDPGDAALIQSTLEEESVVALTVRVQTREAFAAALEAGGIDLILSDYSLPTFDGLTAVKIVQERWPQIPIILVSGTLGEELAIDSLKSGATDYVLKDRLARLAPAIRRAMHEVEAKAENCRTEQSLRETERRLQAVFNESPLGIALVGPDGRPFLTNAALQKMLGYDAEELNRVALADITHADDRAAYLELFHHLLKGELPSYRVEKRYVRKDGNVIWGHLSASMAHERKADFAIVMIEDITERRQLHAQFIEAQKMEVVGQLAAGVAHDFNNILAVIMGYADLTMQALGPNHALRGHLETIRSSGERAAGLTRQLLIFSRKQTVQPVVLDPNEVVHDLDQMLRRLIDENIEMKIEPGEKVGRIRADSGYIGQIVMNLVVNARDAMPNGGNLTIATSNVSLTASDAVTCPGAHSGEYVALSVTDTGTGMTEAVKARLFEAFFTTKPKGKGTGLGLATCHSIVQQSGGCIGVQSELGKGTTFKVYFPRVEQDVDIGTRFFKKGPLPRGTETLLVVEDEPSVRHLARSVLEGQGYEVLSASNGQDALHAARDHKGSPIRLVITDVIMPLMGGKVMAEWLKTTNPNLKILFTSGYTDDAMARNGTLESDVEFLPKPYTPATLTRKVRELLDKENDEARARAAKGAPIANTAFPE